MNLDAFGKAKGKGKGGEKRPLVCYGCGGQGHPQRLCPGTGKGAVDCRVCQGKGHYAAQCSSADGGAYDPNAGAKGGGKGKGDYGKGSYGKGGYGKGAFSKITGAWLWEDGYFCRDLRWGRKDLKYNCQRVISDGNQLTFTSDRGAGDSASFTLRPIKD